MHQSQQKLDTTVSISVKKRAIFSSISKTTRRYWFLTAILTLVTLAVWYLASPFWQTFKLKQAFAQADTSYIQAKLPLSVRSNLALHNLNNTTLNANALAWHGAGKQFVKHIAPTLYQDISPDALFTIQAQLILNQPQIKTSAYYSHIPNTFLFVVTDTHIKQDQLKIKLTRQGLLSWQVSQVCMLDSGENLASHACQ